MTAFDAGVTIKKFEVPSDNAMLLLDAAMTAAVTTGQLRLLMTVLVQTRVSIVAFTAIVLDVTFDCTNALLAKVLLAYAVPIHPDPVVVLPKMALLDVTYCDALDATVAFWPVNPVAMMFVAVNAEHVTLDAPKLLHVTGALTVTPDHLTATVDKTLHPFARNNAWFDKAVRSTTSLLAPSVTGVPCLHV